MTPTLTTGRTRPLHDFTLHDTEHEEPQLSDGGRLTLQRKLDSVWEGLLAAGAAACPACGARMNRAGDTGRCSACRSTLA
jgi:hypothetical protein